MMRLVSVLLLMLMACGAHGDSVVLFLGDGMGISTITAARIFAGQQQGGSGEEHELSFERFDNVALVKTYNTDRQVPDSAGTMSAIVTGEKTGFGMLSVGASVARGDCKQALAAPLRTLLEDAEAAGLSTGIVTTTSITHATPAATYAHVPERDWENDSMLSEAARAAGCRDIAQQLVTMPEGDGIDVILGGGRLHFIPKELADPEYPQQAGRRLDGRNLIEEWLAAGSGRLWAWRQADIERLPSRGQLMGLFQPSHMQFEADRANDNSGEPSLAEMTALAIKRLKRRRGDFFLLVEGGRIDHAHHGGNAQRALIDTVAFDAAVEVAVRQLKPRRSLIMVTADHSHTLTISGYPRRGNPILGYAEGLPGEPLRDANGTAYTTLGYANGPGHAAHQQEQQLEPQALNYQQVATLPMRSETHAGEDVAAYARGVKADMVRGVMEQNELYDALRAALFN